MNTCTARMYSKVKPVTRGAEVAEATVRSIIGRGQYSGMCRPIVFGRHWVLAAHSASGKHTYVKIETRSNITMPY